MKPEKIELPFPRRIRDIPYFFLVALPRSIAEIRAAMRESHCGSKIAHQTREQAARHADRLSARPGSPAFDVYRCRYCNLHHVGRRVPGGVGE